MIAMGNNIDPKTAACFSGHRFLPPSEIPYLKARIEAELVHAYEDGYRFFLCGGALGLDTLAAQVILCFREKHPDIRLVLAIPCATQADNWSEKNRNLWNSIRLQADEVHVLSETYYDGCMQTRNRYMVESTSLCLCYLTRFKGGTWSTVRYALHRGLMVKNLAMPAMPDPVMRENIWNYIYIFHSVCENANTVRLFLSPPEKRKKISISHPCSGKLK